MRRFPPSRGASPGRGRPARDTATSPGRSPAPTPRRGLGGLQAGRESGGRTLPGRSLQETQAPEPAEASHRRLRRVADRGPRPSGCNGRSGSGTRDRTGRASSSPTRTGRRRKDSEILFAPKRRFSPNIQILPKRALQQFPRRDRRPTFGGEVGACDESKRDPSLRTGRCEPGPLETEDCGRDRARGRSVGWVRKPLHRRSEVRPEDGPTRGRREMGWGKGLVSSKEV